MLHTIKNDQLTAVVNEQGAELYSLVADGRELLWNGDAKYWTGRSPNLFPFVGRMAGKQYTYKGKSYQMGIHGFAKISSFACVQSSETHLLLELCDNEETRRQYPFAFRFTVGYTLQGDTLNTEYTVENRSGEAMPFGIGGHPGFALPFADGLAFEDYALTFAKESAPTRIYFSPNGLVDATKPWPLEGGRAIPLRHSLFDDDAVVLEGVPAELVLGSAKGGPALRFKGGQGLRYWGFWHANKSDAPYVCIEPWSSLPGGEGEPVDLEIKQDLLRLEPGGTFATGWSVAVEG